MGTPQNFGVPDTSPEEDGDEALGRATAALIADLPAPPAGVCVGFDRDSGEPSLPAHGAPAVAAIPIPCLVALVKSAAFKSYICLET